MGSGCLGPKKRTGEVYIEIINDIHESAKRINPSENLDLYESIKEKMQKKGLLRKLMDNLASHRNKIPDSVTYNHRIVIQSKTLENHYAGLIIADSIIAGVYSSTRQDYKNGVLSDNSLVTQIVPETLYTQRSNKEKIPLEESMLRQVDTRFQLSYLRMVIYLLDHEQKIYLRVLQSLGKYCSGRTSKVAFTEETWEILGKIGQQINKRHLLQKSIQTYQLLLRQLRDKTKDDIKDSGQVKSFIMIWMREDDSSDIKATLFQIIRIYVARSIASWESNFIYEIIVDIYDGCMFRPKKIHALEDAVIELARGQDLYQQFMKGFFLYLLAYISYSIDEKLATKWDSISWGLSIEVLRTRYPNITAEQSKINALALIRRLARDNHIDINETIAYNRCSFVYAYTFNLNNAVYTSGIRDSIISEFFQTFTQLNGHSVRAVTSLLFDEVKEESNSEGLQKIIIKMIRKIIENYDVFDEKSQTVDFLIELKPSSPRETKIQVIKLTGYVIQKLPNAKIQESIEAICDFLYFLHENLQLPMDPLSFKMQFEYAAISLFKSIQEKGLTLLLLAYLEKITSIRMDQDINPNCKFFNLLHQFQVRELVYGLAKTPQKLKEIQRKIVPGNGSNKAAQSQINQFVEHNMLDVNIAEIKSKTVLNQEEYEYYVQLMHRTFKMEEQHLSEMDESGPSQIWMVSRRSYIKKGSIDNLGGYDSECDQSFNEILDIINQ